MFIPFFQKPEPDDDDQSSGSMDLITLDLSGEHTEAAALKIEPVYVLAGRSNPPDRSDLITLGLEED
ncbi:MAG TPA: hypothetical protein VGJ21_02600 [Terracidiphilus sp.]|jgi:hypothetical protein